jgi:catechol 2,3-dioxygenase-like lactoylglutathione lyase family enzyme
MIGVADADRAKGFYSGLGWREDADFQLDEKTRIIQFTPPGSPCSVQFGDNVTNMEPGAVEELYLIVDDVEAARADLISRGADVSEPWHGRGVGPDGHEPGVDPEHKSYGSFARFDDPDGNSWLLQEIGTRLPGRVTGAAYESAAELAAAMKRASVAHGEHEARTGEADPDWPEWYASYMVAEATGEELPQ